MDKRKMKARRTSRDDQNKPTKEEYAVAKCLKFNAPSKEGKFEGNNVRYFMGSKIVDFLLESQWSSKKSKSNPLFSTRPTCVAYCSRLLSKGFFCRVEKQEKKKKELDSRSKDDAGTLIKRGKSKRDSGKARKAEEEGDSLKAGEQSAEEKFQDQTKDDSSNEDSKKKKKKLPRMNFHGDQKFVDGLDLYVWLYDPVPIKTFVIGLLLVVGAIAVCLFPLWPPEIKLGIYYLSCAAFGFIGFILSLCVVRLVVFVLVWLFSMGEVSLWLLPNLTEDVGFFESFKPLYKINNGSRAKDEKQRLSQGDKESDAKEAVKTEDEEEEEEGLKSDDVNEGEEGDVGEGTLAGEGGYDDDGNESYEVIDAEDDDDDDGGVDDDDDGSERKNAAAEDDDDADDDDDDDDAEEKVEADKKND